MTSEIFHQHAFEVWKTLQNKTPSGIDGIITLASENYLIHWEHWSEGPSNNHPALIRLLKNTDTVMFEEAQPGKVVIDMFSENLGISIRGGECLNLQFDRRKAFLW